VAVARREQAEQSMQDWQSEWEHFNQEAAEPAQSAQVERTRINHLERQEEDLRRRLQRLEDERERLDDSRLRSEIAELELQESLNRKGAGIMLLPPPQVQYHRL